MEEMIDILDEKICFVFIYIYHIAFYIINIYTLLYTTMFLIEKK